MFVKLDESVKRKVNFHNDNEEEEEVMGKGTLAIKVKNGSIMYIHDSFVTFLTTKTFSLKFL
jgi:hypothetical protein